MGSSRDAAEEPFSDWEVIQVKIAARRVPGPPIDDLEAHLFAKLLRLKRQSPKNVRSWRSYCATMLRNEALNFARQWRNQRARELLPSQFGDSEERIDEGFFGTEKGDPDLALAFREMWSKLPEELRTLWIVLEEENGNQFRAAKRLGKHRNTVRLWTQKLRALLKAHGFR